LISFAVHYHVYKRRGNLALVLGKRSSLEDYQETILNIIEEKLSN